MEQSQVDISYSNGRARNGVQYAYIRPAGKCFNRSRRVRADKVESAIRQHFPEVNYYLINGVVIGAKNQNFALREYWRVCKREYIAKDFPVKLISQ